MLMTWVERDGLARSVLVLLAFTTIGSFSYSWGYYEGFYNAKMLAQLEHDHLTAPPTTRTPDASQRKVQTALEPPANPFSKDQAEMAAHQRVVRDKLAAAKAKRSNRYSMDRMERGDRPIHVRSQGMRDARGSGRSGDGIHSHKDVTVTAKGSNPAHAPTTVQSPPHSTHVTHSPSPSRAGSKN